MGRWTEQEEIEADAMNSMFIGALVTQRHVSGCSKVDSFALTDGAYIARQGMVMAGDRLSESEQERLYEAIRTIRHFADLLYSHADYQNPPPARSR